MLFETLNLNKLSKLLKKPEIAVAFVIIIAVFMKIISGIAYESIYASSLPHDKIVILDAGHGGEDCGAIGVSGVYEKDLNLCIAKLLGEMLEKEGITVIYTRTEDRMLYKPEENIKGLRKISDLKNRCKIAEENPSALFVSIHMNSYGAEKYSGLQVYCSDSGESRRLAENIQYSVVERLQVDNKRKVKNGENIYVLENIENVAVLIECGFLSNRAECESLSQKEYQKRLCFSILCGIIEYMK